MNADQTESVRIKSKLAQKFRKLAKEEKRTISGQIELALEKYLDTLLPTA